MAYIYDLRDNPMQEFAMASEIGSGFGRAFGIQAGLKERERRENQKLAEQMYLEVANEAFIQTLSLSSSENWSPKKRHDAIMGIPNWAQTEVGKRYAVELTKQGRSTSTQGDADMANLKDWQESYNKAVLGDDQEMMAFSKDMIAKIIRRINPDYQPQQPRTEGSDILAGKMQKGVNDITGTYGKVVADSIAQAASGDEVDKEPQPKTTTKTDTELAKEFVGAPQPPETPQSRMRKATAKYGQGELEKARQALKPQKPSPYPEYPDAYEENGVWYVKRDGKRYRIED